MDLEEIYQNFELTNLKLVGIKTETEEFNKPNIASAIFMSDKFANLHLPQDEYKNWLYSLSINIFAEFNHLAFYITDSDYVVFDFDCDDIINYENFISYMEYDKYQQCFFIERSVLKPARFHIYVKRSEALSAILPKGNTSISKSFMAGSGKNIIEVRNSGKLFGYLCKGHYERLTNVFNLIDLKEMPKLLINKLSNILYSRALESFYEKEIVKVKPLGTPLGDIIRQEDNEKFKSAIQKRLFSGPEFSCDFNQINPWEALKQGLVFNSGRHNFLIHCLAILCIDRSVEESQIEPTIRRLADLIGYDEYDDLEKSIIGNALPSSISRFYAYDENWENECELIMGDMTDEFLDKTLTDPKSSNALFVGILANGVDYLLWKPSMGNKVERVAGPKLMYVLRSILKAKASQINIEDFKRVRIVFDPKNPRFLSRKNSDKTNFDWQFNEYADPPLIKQLLEKVEQYKDLPKSSEMIGELPKHIGAWFDSITGRNKDGIEFLRWHLTHFANVAINKPQGNDLICVYHGLGGTGKSLYAEFLKRFFAYEDERTQLVKEFSTEIHKSKSRVIVENCFYTIFSEFDSTSKSKNKAEFITTLKEMSGAKTLLLDKKFVNAERIEMFTNFIILTNKQEPLFLDKDSNSTEIVLNRRALEFYGSTKKIRDLEEFKDAPNELFELIWPEVPDFIDFIAKNWGGFLDPNILKQPKPVSRAVKLYVDLDEEYKYKNTIKQIVLDLVDIENLDFFTLVEKFESLDLSDDNTENFKAWLNESGGERLPISYMDAIFGRFKNEFRIELNTFADELGCLGAGGVAYTSAKYTKTPLSIDDRLNTLGSALPAISSERKVLLYPIHRYREIFNKLKEE